MDIHLQQLRYFMELAKQLNFTKAAMNLYIAQPALSQQIADLEKQLGVTLFERTSRSVSLTPAGEILLKACPEILNKMESIHQQLLFAQAGLLGNLKIGYLRTFQTVLPEIIQNYRTDYPDMAVELFCDTLKEMHSSLLSQDADIVFTLRHEDMLFKCCNFACHDLWKEDLCLILRKDHPFVLSGGQDYSLLEDSTFSLLDDETVPDYQRLVFKACNEIGISITKVTFCKSWSPILIQVETGMAVSIFATHDVQRFCEYQKDLVYFPIKKDCLRYCAIWDPNSKNAALPLFLDVMQSTLNKNKTE